MLGGGLQLALIPAPLIVAALVVFALTPRQAGVARTVAGVGIAATIALLAVEAAFLNGGGRIETSLGTPVAGITYLLRLDLPGATLGLAAAAAGLLLLFQGDRRTREVAAVLVCVTGTTLAVLAGNVVMLVGGIEIAGVGTLLMTSAARGRPGRGGLVAIGIEHLGSLALLVAGVQLLSNAGTTDFAVIPAGAMGATVAGPWAAAGVVRLLSPAFVPIRGSRTPTAAWATTAAIPCGAIVLLRLREAAAGPLSEQVTIGLATVGGIAALVAVGVALWRSRVPVIAGRALCVVAAAPVVALTGIAGPSAGAAIAAGVCSLILVTALTPAWEQVGRGRGGTALAAIALGAAGALPIGFGITALILELSATVSVGRPAAALLAALGVSGCLGAAAAVRAAAIIVTQPDDAPRTRHPSLLATAAAAVSVVAAIVPGTVATTVIASLSSGGLTEPIGAAGIRATAGDWSGGYILVAFVVVAAGAWSLATLMGWTLMMHPSPAVRPLSVTRAVGLRVVRRLRPVARRGNAFLHQTDDWLVVQPQLVVVLGGAVALILLFQLIH
jgi:formate hydrogenlyase subunit 3/multisubunit Na+/H+ antiporter MnhD subunit